jgi:hypothetical protein
MAGRGDELASSRQEDAAGAVTLIGEPYTGPTTAEQFAALDVLIGIAALQDKARREGAAADQQRPSEYALTAEMAAIDEDEGRAREGRRSGKHTRRTRAFAIDQKILAILAARGARK